MIKHEVFSDEKKQEPGVIQEGDRFFRVTGVGTTLDTRIESLGFGDSMCNAVYWDEATQSTAVESVWYNDMGGTADIDATREVWAKAKASVFGKAVEWARGVAENRSRDIIQGRVVKVIKGRKFPKGAEATVKFTGQGDWGPYARVIFNDGSEGFISQDNIEVLNPARYLASEAEILAEAEKHWKGWIWK